MSLPAGYNFRSTSGYVTDSAPDIFVAGGSPPTSYPTTFSNGETGGWESIYGTFSVDARDRNTTYPRIAGLEFAKFDDEQFRLDLPSTGSYDIQFGAGDANYTNNVDVDFIDSSTTFASATTTSMAASSVIDANGTVASRSSWNGGTNSRGTVLNRTFSSTIFRTLLIYSGGGKVSHLYIASAAAAEGLMGQAIL